MDKPIPEAVVTQFCDKMLTAAIGKDWRKRAPEAVTAFWMGEVREALQEVVPALTAAQQQQGQAVAFEGTDREVLREFIRMCREDKPVGQWPGERVCAAIERSMANERPFRFIAEADMAPEREPSMKDTDRALSGPRRNTAPPPSAPVGVDAPGSRAWMAEVCRAAALSLAAHGVRNDQLSKVADWIAQQPAAVDRARFRKAPCYLCGYNGAGYFQPETHPCAALYHAAMPGDSENG